MKVSKYGPGLFMYQYRGTLHGLLVTHIDDFLRGGSHVFVENVIKPLHKIFEIGSVNKKAFRYLGLYLKQGDCCYFPEQFCRLHRIFEVRWKKRLK